MFQSQKKNKKRKLYTSIQITPKEEEETQTMHAHLNDIKRRIRNANNTFKQTQKNDKKRKQYTNIKTTSK